MASYPMPSVTTYRVVAKRTFRTKSGARVTKGQRLTADLEVYPDSPDLPEPLRGRRSWVFTETTTGNGWRVGVPVHFLKPGF